MKPSAMDETHIGRYLKLYVKGTPEYNENNINFNTEI